MAFHGCCMQRLSGLAFVTLCCVSEVGHYLIHGVPTKVRCFRIIQTIKQKFGFAPFIKAAPHRRIQLS